jgi:hypothetical protein
LKDTIRYCSLLELTDGSVKFPWHNARQADQLIATKIDRAYVNNCWLDSFPESKLTILKKSLLDHNALIVNCNVRSSWGYPPFRFRKMWTRISAGALLRTAGVPLGPPMLRVTLKLTEVKRRLSEWNHNELGSIFDQIDSVRSRMLYMNSDVEQSGRLDYGESGSTQQAFGDGGILLA